MQDYFLAKHFGNINLLVLQVDEIKIIGVVKILRFFNIKLSFGVLNFDRQGEFLKTTAARWENNCGFEVADDDIEAFFNTHDVELPV